MHSIPTNIQFFAFSLCKNIVLFFVFANIQHFAFDSCNIHAIYNSFVLGHANLFVLELVHRIIRLF